MNICAVICEFNPLQNGHQLILEKARELSSCDFVLCIMSGNFTQRGEEAIVDKFVRAKIAMLCGADMVVHNPTPFSTSSSEIFSLSSVKIANSFENVTHLCFGSECGDIDALKKCAKFFANEPKEYSSLLKKYLQLGNSFNQSRTLALEEYSKTNQDAKEYSSLLQSPNNILAVEYIKALILTKSKIEPLTIKRENNFNSKDLTKFASSTAIRNELYNSKKLSKCKDLMPKKAYSTLNEYFKTHNLPKKETLSDIVLYSIRTSPLSEIKNTFDVKEGLENRIKDVAKNSTNIEEYFEKVATKRYQAAKLRRIATHLLLGIKEEDVLSIYKYKTLPYIKVLAANKKILSSNIRCNTNLIVRNCETKNLPKDAKRLIEIEDRTEQVYSLLTGKTTTIPYLLQTSIIISF